MHRLLANVAVVTATLVTFFAPASYADVRIAAQQSADHLRDGQLTRLSSEDQVVVWLADDSARMDRGEKSTILVPGRMYFLDHAKKTLEIVTLPATLLDLLEEPERQVASRMHQKQKGLADQEEEPTNTEVRGWQSQKFLYSVQSTVSSRQVSFWTTDDVATSDRPYRDMMSAWNDLRMGDQWMNEIFDTLPGFLVKTEIRQPDARGTLITTLEFLEIEKISPDPSRFRPPEGYTPIPLDISRWFKIAEPRSPGQAGRNR